MNFHTVKTHTYAHTSLTADSPTAVSDAKWWKAAVHYLSDSEGDLSKSMWKKGQEAVWLRRVEQCVTAKHLSAHHVACSKALGTGRDIMSCLRVSAALQ